MTVKDINIKSFELLKKWCDKLIDMQITERKNPGVYGGILCEACGYIHGRIADAVYPMTAVYFKTGDKKYLESAVMLYDWSRKNVKSAKGYNVNDTFNMWHGTTVFYAISLGETLLDFGDVLPPEIKEKWFKSFVCAADAVAGDSLFIPVTDSHVAINYPVAYLPAMALAAILTGDDRYTRRAVNQEERVLEYISGSGWLFGETLGGYTSPTGCRAVDLGYNVEESIGNFALYGKLSGRERFTAVAADMLKKAAEFMLPDGAWDNSWGSRANKWTYYGSRTSDGCQTACALLQDVDPLFAELCIRNTLLLDKMTQNGLLTGGVMYENAGYGACAHHTFCHAKALAHLVKHPIMAEKRMPLPCEAKKGISALPEAGVTLISAGSWRATMQSHDLKYISSQEISGGAPALIYHAKAGTLFVGNGVTIGFTEPTNMQIPRDTDNICQTIRVCRGGFNSQYCKNAEIISGFDNGCARYSARGQLTDINGATDCTYRIFYTFKDDTFSLSVVCDKAAQLQLPLVCAPEAPVSCDGDRYSFGVNGYVVTLEADRAVDFAQGREKDRVFNTVGGFCTLPLSISLTAREPVKISVTVTPEA